MKKLGINRREPGKTKGKAKMYGYWIEAYMETTGCRGSKSHVGFRAHFDGEYIGTVSRFANGANVFTGDIVLTHNGTCVPFTCEVPLGVELFQYLPASQDDPHPGCRKYPNGYGPVPSANGGCACGGSIWFPVVARNS